jgi:hypothetical protein
MHERKKKGGKRKDKKMQRMREDVEQRKEQGEKSDHESDQKDIVTYKSGSAEDRTVDPSAFKGGRGPVSKEPGAPRKHGFKK